LWIVPHGRQRKLRWFSKKKDRASLLEGKDAHKAWRNRRNAKISGKGGKEKGGEDLFFLKQRNRGRTVAVLLTTRKNVILTPGKTPH